jgi:hypothetical protein
MAGLSGIRGAAQRVSEHARALLRLEAELAQAELKRKAGRAGAGVAMFVVAAMLGFITLEMVVAVLTAVLAIWLPVWASVLIMLAVVAAAAGGIAYMGSRQMKAASPLAPTEAIAQAKAIPAALKSSARMSAAIPNGASSSAAAPPTIPPVAPAPPSPSGGAGAP